MTEGTPPDWVLLEAAKRCDMFTKHIDALRYRHTGDSCFRALCDMIAKYEKKPADRKLLCAREATKYFESKRPTMAGYVAFDLLEPYVAHAIELYEEGFGK
jgi:hypothetical protein